MSEEILKALAQLFAIITKQDAGVTEKEREYVITSFKKKLNLDTVKKYVELYDEFVGYKEIKTEGEPQKEKLTSVKDSVKTLALCRKINKTLTQKQKVVVLLELFELVRSDGNLTPQRMGIIDTVSTTFNISKEEYKSIEDFALNKSDYVDQKEVLIINNNHEASTESTHRHIFSEQAEGNILFLLVKSVDMIFLKYSGHEAILHNGLPLEPNSIVLFSSGSTVRLPKGDCFYYSDILSNFYSELKEVKLSFNVSGLEFRFPNNTIGLRDINLSEASGKLIGIMGASGAGKTTLLNVMAGLEKPFSGEVRLNGFDIHKEKKKISGMIGYIAQDDLLIEELSVFENIYFNAKLCFKDFSDGEISKLVDKVLSDLGLIHIKNLEVGNSLNKKISGGQRKRLNIALELIREPAVLFVDEPTSGLSSRDSENVIDLLKELSRKGTLIFVVIHQPSSDIYKIFDRMIILDAGGYLIFNGNPVEAVTYFRKLALQADSDHGQCQTCGNVNPEQIFNIIEERVVDEYGNFTLTRKVTPAQWWNYYKENFRLKIFGNENDAPLKMLQIPSKISQFVIFSFRDVKAKISNKQYMAINLLEAPLLAFILAFIIRYKNDPSQTVYVYRYNENIPAYILMSIVVALFMGLSVSAEEIIKDRKILKRESFLDLSRLSYLFSKTFILFSFSAVQSFLFVIVGNSLMEIKGMSLSYWLVLFSTSCLANILGLMISSAFKTAITVYILIPLLLIPQMILSGAMFSFDKVNDVLRSEDKVPVIADLMASRWAFEALAVRQYTNNGFEKPIYESEQITALTNFNLVYLLPELHEKLNYVKKNYGAKNYLLRTKVEDAWLLLTNEIYKQKDLLRGVELQTVLQMKSKPFDKETLQGVSQVLEKLEDVYNDLFNKASKKKDDIIDALDKSERQKGIAFKDIYFNESLSDLVNNTGAEKRFVEINQAILPKIDLIYFGPGRSKGLLDYRAHFFSPFKNFMGLCIDTYIFNVLAIWFLTLILWLFLYFDLLRKLMEFPEKIAWRNKTQINIS
jgi:ABC-type multidrug transport system ATPase subunit